jgi:phage recombination protein Bet
MTSTAVTQKAASSSLISATSFSSDEVEVIRALIAPGTDDAELAVFLRVAQKYDLDPFTKQIYAIKNEKRPQDAAIIMVSRDGFLAIAERSGVFDGMHAGVVKEGDTFRPGRDEAFHEYGEKREKIVCAYAYVYRTDRSHPASFVAPWAEYGAPNTRDAQGKIKSWSPWSKYPSALIQKVAEANALKRAFTVTGVSTEAAEETDEQPIAYETVELPPGDPDGEIPVFDEVPEGQLSVEEVLDPEDAA